MPEGDTLHRAAESLRRAIGGRRMRRAEIRPGPSGPVRGTARPPSAGSVVETVEARGKHLLIGFGDGTVLHTHLRMSGSWHIYRPGERWRKPPRHARVVLETEDAVAVCFSAPVVELLRARDLDRHPALAALGPDLCRPEPDLDEVLRRLEELLDPGTEIGIALLDQRVASGIGNVYKSEVLFARRVSPATPLRSLQPEERRAMFATASQLLRRNLGGGPRSTVDGGGLAVYGRAGRPCRACRAPIRSRRQGDPPRATYWCPSCQPEAAGRGPA